MPSTMSAPKSAPTVVAAVSVCEPAAIESRMPKSIPPYMPITGRHRVKHPQHRCQQQPEDKVNDHPDCHAEEHGDDHVHSRPDGHPHTQCGQRTDEHPNHVVAKDEVHTSLPTDSIKERDSILVLPCLPPSADFPFTYRSGSCRNACFSAS